MKVNHEVHESLSVHGHQVDNLSHRAGLTSLVAETKSLYRYIIILIVIQNNNYDTYL